MILISHRGNIDGPDPSMENSPDYIQKALDKGYDVEVDVWFDKVNRLMLGHDKPQYPINVNFLMNCRLWCHAKNLEAINYLSCFDTIHYFWHENDRYTITSRGYIWSFPRVLDVLNCVIVYPELYPDDFDFSMGVGICSDHIKDYKKYR
jgi:hypothetical protein